MVAAIHHRLHSARILQAPFAKHRTQISHAAKSVIREDLHLNLGEKGAERLLGKGHSATKLEGTSEIVYGQVPFVDNEFLILATSRLKLQG